MNFYSTLPISNGSIRYSRGNLEVINQVCIGVIVYIKRK